MKILMINTVELARNGISTCILNYSGHIVSTEFQVDIAVPNIVDQELRKMISAQGIGLYELPVRKENTFKYFIGLKKLINKGQYDVVHVHGNSCTMAIDLLAAWLAGCKVRIAHSHNTTCEHLRAHKILRPLFELVCTGRFACGREAGEWLFRHKPFTVIKNGIDFCDYFFDENVRQKLRREYGITDDTFLLGHVGLFNYQKNHEFLIELVKYLKKEKEIKYKLFMIGNGEREEHVRAQIRECDCQNMIIMPGSVGNVPDFLQAMDIFVLPSRFEGLPYVLIEAQAAGLPILASSKVSTEVNLTGTIKFLDLDSVEDWIGEIKHCQRTVKHRDRTKAMEQGMQRLEASGYNMKKNSQALKESYIRMVSDKRKV